jgi:hypothetical protein
MTRVIRVRCSMTGVRRVRCSMTGVRRVRCSMTEGDPCTVFHDRGASWLWAGVLRQRRDGVVPWKARQDPRRDRTASPLVQSPPDPPSYPVAPLSATSAPGLRSSATTSAPGLRSSATKSAPGLGSPPARPTPVPPLCCELSTLGGRVRPTGRTCDTNSAHLLPCEGFAWSVTALFGVLCRYGTGLDGTRSIFVERKTHHDSWTGEVGPRHDHMTTSDPLQRTAPRRGAARLVGAARLGSAWFGSSARPSRRWSLAQP